MTVFVIALQAGIALASIYLLTALSFTLVLGISGVFNFLQATILMLATLFSFELVASHGWPSLAVLPVLIVFGVGGGFLTHLLAVRPALRRSKHLLETTLLTTLGLGTAVNAFAGLKFGSDSRPVPSYISTTPWQVGSIPVNKAYVVIVLAVAAITLTFALVLRKTEAGVLTRATLEDPDGARLLGINTPRLVVVAFCIAGALAATGGWLVAPVISASAYSAQDLAFYAFAAMAIGGFGSFEGAMLGAVIIGLTAGIVPAYLNPDWVNPIVLALVAGLLTARPAGLLGTAGLFGATAEREI